MLINSPVSKTFGSFTRSFEGEHCNFVHTLLEGFLEEFIIYLDYSRTRMTQETTENETDEFCEEKMK